VYPNPVENTLHITLNEALAKAELYSLLGEKLITSTETTIPVFGLLSGMYVLKITTQKGKVAIHKIMKQ